MPIPCRLDIPLLPHTALGHALHLLECLRGANLLARLRLGPSAPTMGWRFCDASGAPASSIGGPLAALAEEGAFSGPATAVLVAPLHCPDIPAVRAAAQAAQGLSRRIGVALDQGQRVLTVSNGAWVAAASQRLQGRRVALPWYYIAGFERDYPDIRVALDDSFVEDGPWLSADLPSQSVRMALALTREGMGQEMADALTAAVQPDPARSRAAHDAVRSHQIPATRDSTLARAMAYLEKNLEQPYALAQVAQAAAVSPRTLLRHFQDALGQSPLDHLHQLRCARAKVLLEITLESVPSIALACGYSDPAAFRRIFARHTGMTPTAYRERLTLRAPRKRWRVDPQRP